MAHYSDCYLHSICTLILIQYWLFEVCRLCSSLFLCILIYLCTYISVDTTKMYLYNLKTHVVLTLFMHHFQLIKYFNWKGRIGNDVSIQSCFRAPTVRRRSSLLPLLCLRTRILRNPRDFLPGEVNKQIVHLEFDVCLFPHIHRVEALRFPLHHFVMSAVVILSTMTLLSLLIHFNLTLRFTWFLLGLFSPWFPIKITKMRDFFFLCNFFYAARKLYCLSLYVIMIYLDFM